MSRQAYSQSPAPGSRRGSNQQAGYSTFGSQASTNSQRRGSSTSTKPVNSPKTSASNLHHSHSGSIDTSSVPSTPTSSSSILERDLRELIGVSLKISLVPSGNSIPERFYTGLLWCYDASMGCLALECPPTNNDPEGASGSKQNKCYRVIKINQIKSVQVLSSNKEEKLHVTMKSINLHALQAREAQAVEAEVMRRGRIGPKGVTKEGQDLFDALSKTMPVRWAGTSIVVLEEVIISPPYNLTDCKANAKDTARLERVKKVMEGEQLRMGINTPT